MCAEAPPTSSMTRLIYAPHHRLENQHTRRGPLPGHFAPGSWVSRLGACKRTCEFTRKVPRSNGPTRAAPRKSGLPVCATLYYLYSTMSHLSTHGGARFSFLLRSPLFLALSLGFSRAAPLREGNSRAKPALSPTPTRADSHRTASRLGWAGTRGAATAAHTTWRAQA